MKKLELEPLYEALDTVLNRRQMEKMKRLFEEYPHLTRGDEVVVSTADLCKVVGSRSDNLIRDLTTISKATNRLHIEQMSEKKNKGGRGKCHTVRLEWKSFNKR